MNKEKTNGKLRSLDLFSGYGGITLALREYVEPVMYCEIERYAQAMLISRMDDGSLPFAPVWNDVTTLDGTKLRGLVDFVNAGFPCQDISSAGKGAGLDGKRSGLFYEVIRICKEASPLFIFLENVAAIRTRGSIEVQEELASLGYDCRFGMLSAAEVGAVHERDRWFCLAKRRDAADAISIGTQVQTKGHLSAVKLFRGQSENGKASERIRPTESPICGANDVVANRVDRIKALGNGVAPPQVKAAFEILMGINK